MKRDSQQYRVEVEPFNRLSKAAELSWSNLVDVLKLNLSLKPFWLRAVIEGWQLDSTAIHIFMLFDDEVLQGVIPYQIETKYTFGIPLKVISLASRYVSYHPELISRLPASILLEWFFGHTKGKWDKLILDNLVENGKTAVEVANLCASRNWLVLDQPVDVAPYLSLAGTWDDLVSSKRRKSRYSIRKRNNELRSSESLRLEWFTKAEEVDRFLSALIMVEQNSWKAVNKINVSFSNREGRYYSRLLPMLAQCGGLRANVLWHFDQPIAYSLACHWAGWVGHLKTAFDNDFEKFSAGALVIDASIKDAFELGAYEFDFLGTAGQLTPDPHKLRWTNETRRHCNVEVFPNHLLPRAIGYAKATRNFLRDSLSIIWSGPT